jgi:mono/diheme cytochrome c family protein
MAQHLADPSTVTQQPEMSPVQLQSLTALVGNLTPANGTAVANAPDLPVFGAHVYASQQCAFCHLVNGEGQTLGPPLNGVGQRRDAAWLTGHFREPAALVEGSTMPPFPLPDPEMEALVAYMLALKN